MTYRVKHAAVAWEPSGRGEQAFRSLLSICTYDPFVTDNYYCFIFLFFLCRVIRRLGASLLRVLMFLFLLFTSGGYNYHYSVHCYCIILCSWLLLSVGRSASRGGYEVIISHTTLSSRPHRVIRLGNDRAMGARNWSCILFR